MYLRIWRDGKFADGIYTRALPYPLGIQDLPALVNEKRSVHNSVPDGQFMHLAHEDKMFFRDWVLNARPGQEINFIDSHDAANWHIEMEEAQW